MTEKSTPEFDAGDIFPRDELGFTERDYYWTDQALSDARHAESQKAERSRQWREEACAVDSYIKPARLTNQSTDEEIAQAYREDHMPKKFVVPTPRAMALKKLSQTMEGASKSMKHVGKAAKKASEAFEYAFPGHLTHRPFHNLQMIVLRDDLAKNQ